MLLQKAQLGIQDDEIQCLKQSLEEEQRRYTWLQHETHAHTEKLQTHIQQLLQQQQDEHRDAQRLQVTTSNKAEGAATSERICTSHITQNNTFMTCTTPALHSGSVYTHTCKKVDDVYNDVRLETGKCVSQSTDLLLTCY